ncbi:MAG: alpha-1,4-glucan--maltose-1-phosphate maltosyltransferase [Mesorhizobium sp.]|nr:MAG: alpha-1,4-glucan--maltose-1-phosphate maltosyltransferase [Mesorhizobium sp.]TIO29304.1 MAG: alpha-1,4-glucan--maltose-1-phosphate maltosyltransferase [Mesorhizobium sp.]TIP09898.1 MAG: alpha-1,4-glucan--maltose-1-phosphate maltosyltransferase [Mesorhizobium sp.]
MRTPTHSNSVPTRGGKHFVLIDEKKASAAKARFQRSANLQPRKPQDQPRELDAMCGFAANRIAIEGVSPEIDGGRFPAKCVAGEKVLIEADIFGNGHDTVAASLLYRPAGTEGWTEQPMTLLENDRWTATVVLGENRLYQFTFGAWHDLYATWRKEAVKKHTAGQNIALEMQEGRRLLQSAVRSDRAGPDDVAELEQVLASFEILRADTQRLALLSSDAVAAVMSRGGVRTNLSYYHKVLEIFADRKTAAFSAWYELFPRSQSGDPARHGTFDDVINRLPYVRDLGFDVLYFPPIHPIGETNRKGRNNSLKAELGDVGSPYAIGSKHGGHDAIHPELGSFEDFHRLVAAARRHGLEVAIDFAIQCSPDHPWIKAHPEWFDWRPDGSLEFAENSPKKYEDIVNVNIHGDAFPGLWHALRDIVLFWIGHGVKIFRVDNPHTKPFAFWEWMIGEVRSRHPETIFLAEGFTHSKVMKRLAKVGFNQSYSYFTWRNLKRELEEYLTELTQEECRHYMRPNFFANTPDINPIYLQHSGRPGFQARLILAGTLGGNYGIYNGFEICEAEAVPGKEEYLNSEKYQIRAWNMDEPGNLQWDIGFVNRLRRNHKSLQDFTNLAFYNAWNDNIIYYGKRTADLSDFLLFHVCLDPHSAQGADFEVPLWELGLTDDAPIEVEDMVTDRHFTWHGKIQHIHLDPFYKPYAVWRLISPGAHAGQSRPDA